MLTRGFSCDYNGGIETCYTAFTPRQSVFFMPFGRMRAENILNISQSFIAASIESATSHCKRWLIEKAIKMKNLITYNFKQNQIRTQMIEGNPWFCLVDCCKALEIKQNRDTATRLSSKGVGKTDILTNGGKQQITIINEPNLYRLIFRSNKPQAQAFADWVYSEVLPSIRKTGAYVSPAQQELGLVPVREYTRRLPSKPKEIKLSEKARAEIGGIVKAVVNNALDERLPSTDLTQAIDDSDALLTKGYMTIDEVKNCLYSLINFTGRSNLKEMRKMYLVFGALKNLLVKYETISAETVWQLEPLFKQNKGHNFNELIHNVRVMHTHNMHCPVRTGR